MQNIHGNFLFLNNTIYSNNCDDFYINEQPVKICKLLKYIEPNNNKNGISMVQLSEKLIQHNNNNNIIVIDR